MALVKYLGFDTKTNAHMFLTDKGETMTIAADFSSFGIQPTMPYDLKHAWIDQMLDDVNFYTSNYKEELERKREAEARKAAKDQKLGVLLCMLEAVKSQKYNETRGTHWGTW